MAENITAGQTVTMTNRRGETSTATVLLVHPDGVYARPMARIEFLDGPMRGQTMDFATSRMTVAEDR